MGSENEIYPEHSNFMSVAPAGHPSGTELNFVVISHEAAEGIISQLAFKSDDGEKLVAGLVEALASQGSSVGQLLLKALSDADATKSTDEEFEQPAVEEQVTFEEDDDEEDDPDFNIAVAIDPYDIRGDEFGVDA